MNNIHHFNLIEKLQKAEHMSITCDFWSNRTSKSFLVMTGHYLSNSFELYSTVIDFSHFQERHFSENIMNYIYKKLDRLNVLGRVSAVTCDGASNMKKAFDTFGAVDRLWCLGHRLHLIVTNAFGFWLKDKNKDINDTIDDTTTVGPTDDVGDLDTKDIFNDEEDALAVNDSDEETEMVIFSLLYSIREMLDVARLDFFFLHSYLCLEREIKLFSPTRVVICTFFFSFHSFRSSYHI